MLSRRRPIVLALVLATACGPGAPAGTTADSDGSSTGTTGPTLTTTSTGPEDPTTTTAEPDVTTSTSTSTGDASTTSPDLPGCGDGVAEPGELCYDLVIPEYPSYLTRVALADINADGHLDLVGLAVFLCPLTHEPSLAAAGPSGTPRDGGPASVQFVAALGDGAGGFASTFDLLPSGAGGGDLAVADFTGDGHLDVAADGPYPDNKILVFPGDGTGNFGGVPIETVVPVFASTLDAGDLDGDGDVDLVFASYKGLGVLLGDGLGSFSPAVIAVDTHYDHPVLRDLDQDGDLDFMILRGDAEAVETFLNAGDASFTAGQSVAVSGFPIDLVVVDPAKGERPAALVTTSKANVGHRLEILAIEDDGTLAAPETHPAGEAEYLAVGRFDGAPRPDVIAVGYPDVSAILGEEPWPPFSKIFAESPDYAQSHLAVGDINEDGLDDVVIPEYAPFLLLSNP